MTASLCGAASATFIGYPLIHRSKCCSCRRAKSRRPLCKAGVGCELLKYGFHRVQFLVRSIRARTGGLLLEERLQFCNRVCALLQLLKGARRHAMHEGVRLPQCMRFAGGRDNFLEVAVVELC